MEMTLLKIVFLLSAALILYVYFGYPLLLLFLGLLRKREIMRDEITPPVTIIIAAHNEAQSIAEKLENSLSLNYPRERLEVILASDGSTDETVAIAESFKARGVLVLDLARSGKITALNRAVETARGEILVFTDANAIFEPDALRYLVSNFADAEVGGVCGNQRYRKAGKHAGDSSGEGENLYWKYDKFIKRLESRQGSTVAADGSIYAVRAELFAPLGNTAQADDHAISARVVTAGKRLVFDERAVSYEEPPADGRREFRRKVRVTNHTVSSIINLPAALDPRITGFYTVELFSHKILRYAVPFLMIIAFLANSVLIGQGAIYRFMLAAQVLFYICALTGFFLRTNKLGRVKPFYVPYYFCLANAASLLGTLSRLRGDQVVIWQPRGENAPVITRR
jgi:cellulose synthase/poly-beta-1,6-N-acetylglucosamine synthase-like glycosyltransferase